MNDPTRDQLWADVYKQVKAENKFACNPKRDADMAVREYDARLASPAAAPTSQPNAAAQEQGTVRVPLKFVQGFCTLAHNYSLKAVPPDYYSGTEGDAFSNAYRRCGQDLAKLRALIPSTPITSSAPAPAPTGMGSVGLPSGRGEEA